MTNINHHDRDCIDNTKIDDIDNTNISDCNVDIIKQYFNTGSIIDSVNNIPNNDDINDDVIDNVNDEIEIKDENDTIIGIDLGTTNTCVSIWRNNNLEIIPDDYGNKTIPSFVAFTNKSRYIGNDAKNQKDLNPKNVFYEVKRLIGKKYDDVTVSQDKEYFTYDISCSDQNNINLILDSGKKFTPEEISSIILQKVKNMASHYLKKNIYKAVITVPAYFNDSQRQATKDAATIAGLECVRIINEPTAAALAYGLLNKSLTKSSDTPINVLVYDLGGGTLDVSILTITGGIFEVLSSVGNTHLGGADFDNRLMGYCILQFKKKYNIDKLDDINVLSMQKLRRTCENAKILLSTCNNATIAVKNFYLEYDLIINLSRDKYVNICKDLLILCLKPIEDALNSASMNRNNIDEIILVGGMTRMPIIRENIKNFFNGKNPNCTINPDEVVSAGAAIQAHILSNTNDPFSENVTLLDIIPLSLGIETIGGIMNVLIPRNSVIPISKKKIYTTDTDYCDSVLIKIFEGERKMTKDNFLVGEFELGDIELCPRGIPQIEVKFNVDINGIITVTAINKDKQNTKSITITGNKGRLKPDEINKLVEEAKIYDLKDKIEKQKKQLYYEIEDLSSNITINIKNDNYKLTNTDKKMINEDINKVIVWLKEKNYYDRDIKEFKNIIEKIKQRYGTLILKANISDDNVIGNTVGNEKNNSTTVFGNDDDEDDSKNIFEQIENDEMGINKLSDNEKTEIKQLRNNLMELCNNINDIISSDSLNFKKEHIKELRDFIDDVLLWIHVNQNQTKTDYKLKIDEINNACNKLLEEYKNSDNIFEPNEITKNIKTKRDELEQLCLTIKSSIDCNIFSLDEKCINELNDQVVETLNWIIDNTHIEHSEDVFVTKLNKINELCDKLYHSMIGISINNTNSVIDSEIENSNIFIEGEMLSGTNIHNL